MQDDRIAKKHINWQNRTRRVGKPRTSWLTSVLARTGMRLGDVIRKAEKRCDWSLLNFQAAAYVRPPMRNMTATVMIMICIYIVMYPLSLGVLWVLVN